MMVSEWRQDSFPPENRFSFTGSCYMHYYYDTLWVFVYDKGGNRDYARCSYGGINFSKRVGYVLQIEGKECIGHSLFPLPLDD